MNLVAQLKPEDIKEIAVMAAGMAQENILRGLMQPFARSSMPSLGDVWPGQGGSFVAFVRGKNGGRDYCLIAAPEEFEFTASFGSHGKSIETCSYDGAANTKLMTESALDFPAAKKCTEVVCEGHSDYFLMARHESRIVSLCAPELFKKDSYYWTSTQSSAGNACCQYFDVGGQYLDDKITELRVRPVRSFLI